MAFNGRSKIAKRLSLGDS